MYPVKRSSGTVDFRRRDGSIYGIRVILQNAMRQEYGVSMQPIVDWFGLTMDVVHETRFTPEQIRELSIKLKNEFETLRLFGYKESLQNNFREVKRTFVLMDTKNGHRYIAHSRMTICKEQNDE